MYVKSGDPAPVVFCTRRLCSVADNGIVKADPIRRDRCSTEYDERRVTNGLDRFPRDKQTLRLIKGHN